MPITIEQKKYYRIKGACRQVDISKATYHRWIKRGLISDNILEDQRWYKWLI